MYGLEREGIPPSKTVEKREATRILNTVQIYIEKIDKAIAPHLWAAALKRTRQTRRSCSPSSTVSY